MSQLSCGSVERFPTHHMLNDQCVRNEHKSHRAITDAPGISPVGEDWADLHPFFVNCQDQEYVKKKKKMLGVQNQ